MYLRALGAGPKSQLSELRWSGEEKGAQNTAVAQQNVPRGMYCSSAAAQGVQCIAQSRCWRGPVVGFSCQWLTKAVSVSRVPYLGQRDRNPYRNRAGKKHKGGPGTLVSQARERWKTEPQSLGLTPMEQQRQRQKQRRTKDGGTKAKEEKKRKKEK
ncbi:hypothetical protein LY76DRAFT_604173 [Colletotrichum caudatum]|nr:hypothetical protein LY76DRAFT_604173 [Colletotrichum caudatum]